MPPKSQAQRRAMYAAKEGKSTLGIPQSVGAEFEADDHAKNLPQRAAPKAKPAAKKAAPKGKGKKAPPPPVAKQGAISKAAGK